MAVRGNPERAKAEACRKGLGDAQASRARAATRGRKGTRKDRVLHTRISEKLAAEIARVARDLRVPASNLVRNVLEDAFSVVESVTDNVEDFIESVLGEAERARERIVRSVRRTDRVTGKSETPQDHRETPAGSGVKAEKPEFAADVVGWQPILLNAPRQCGDCGAQLGKGERALVGLAATGLTDKYLCLTCMNART